MDTDTQTKKAEIITMMRGFPSSKDQVSQGTISAYLIAVSDCSVHAVSKACYEFLAGKVEGRNNVFIPTASELADHARKWDDTVASASDSGGVMNLIPYDIGALPPPNTTPLGPIKLEVNGLMRDVSHMSYDDKMKLLSSGKMPEDTQDGVVKISFKRMG